MSIRGERQAEILRTADIDGNGQVCFEEFSVVVLKTRESIVQSGREEMGDVDEAEVGELGLDGKRGLLEEFGEAIRRTADSAFGVPVWTALSWISSLELHELQATPPHRANRRRCLHAARAAR